MGVQEEMDVRLVELRKSYGDVVAVDQVDCEIARGEFFTMLGPSGSGKTTTLRLIAGFEEPDRGRVELGGRDVTGVPPYDREVNTVFQDYALFPHMSVAENIEYGLKIHKVAKPERTRRREEALEMVRLSGYGPRRPSEMATWPLAASTRSCRRRRSSCSRPISRSSTRWTSSRRSIEAVIS